MKPHLAPLFLAYVDVFGCALIYALAAISPMKAKTESPEMKAEYVIKITWPSNVDADVDNWLQTPRGTVFYKAEHRQIGCVTLDMDNHGYEDSKFVMLNGETQTVAESAEVITLRCKDPGVYNHAIHLYGYIGKPSTDTHLGLKVHVEFAALNPSYRPLYEKDVTLDYVQQSINDFSFEIGGDGGVKLRDPPLKWITDFYYHPEGHE